VLPVLEERAQHGSVLDKLAGEILEVGSNGVGYWEDAVKTVHQKFHVRRQSVSNLERILLPHHQQSI